MTNHPNRSKYRYFEVCPRGFVNEITYIRVREDEIEAVEKHFDGWIDRQFDAGETGAICGWTDDKRARVPGISLTWDDYRLNRY